MSGRMLIFNLVAVLLMSRGVHAQGQAADNPQSTAQPAKPASHNFLGLKDCFSCHTNGFPKDDFGNQFGIMANDSWIRGDEVRVWGKDDKHAQAYTSLLSETGRRIGNAMSPSVISHHDKRCLACHTGFPVSSMETETGEAHGPIKGQKYDEDLKITVGVSCEGCHGEAREWLSAHISKDNWRFLSNEQKNKKGFTDVRSVIPRTKLCLSCHLGNAAEGRVVTHDMYAAGHPPLPAFELETFEATMPKHWRSLSEKDEKILQEFLKKTGQPDPGEELTRSKALLVSSLVAKSESLRLTADLAEGVVSDQILKPQWPEFSQYDCYACHHDLKSESWRQKVQHAGSPGRPVLTPWPDAILRIAMQQSSEPTSLQQALADVEAASLKSPFGDTRTLVSSSRKAAALAEEMAQAINQSKLTEVEGRSVLQRIVETGSTEVLDYDSARQLVWAYSVIKNELGPQPMQKSDDERSEILLPEELISLNAVFLLDFRNGGRDAEHTVPSANKPRPVKEVDLSKVLPPIAQYDPSRFQAVFAELMKKPSAK
jgi:hypothetical protein